MLRIMLMTQHKLIDILPYIIFINFYYTQNDEIFCRPYKNMNIMRLMSIQVIGD